MAASTFGKREFFAAMRALGQAVGGYDEIEIVLVGGLAGLLGGWLPPTLTTRDADIVDCDPEHAAAHIENEAFHLAAKLGLPPHWLNSAAQGFAWALPPDWRTRLHTAGTFGLLTVRYIDRPDLIALKVVASRDVDRAHLLQMSVTVQEIDAVGRHLRALEAQGVSVDRIEQARATLAILSESA